jgi:7-cyano-7-deazaguanine synthase
MTKNAVILLSGGLDSATVLHLAKAQGYQLYAMSFRYGQRHAVELESSRKIAQQAHVKDHKIVDIDLRAFGGSALTDDIAVPKHRSTDATDIPITYVPARNTIFLSFALGWAEVLNAFDIFIGANAIDYSGYPDCRGEYLQSFETMANLATKAGVEGTGHFTIHAPLLTLTKAEIIAKGIALGVDYKNTTSCYDPSPEGKPCRACDSCQLRKRGFEENGMVDPLYRL